MHASATGNIPAWKVQFVLVYFGMMNGRLENLLVELKAGLRQLYGPRLVGVYLYGSYARGEQAADSDMDVLVVLDQVDHYCAEIDRTGYLTAALSLKYGVSISRVLVGADEWQTADTPLLVNARLEGVAA